MGSAAIQGARGGYVILRAYRPGDARACFDLFRLAILEGAAPFYDSRQRAAWAGTGEMGDGWPARLAAMHTVVAEENRAITGFMSLRADGHLDLAFVHPDRRRGGLAARLLQRITDHARHRGMGELTTEASHMARRFFLKHGWQEDAAQTVERQGVTLENFRMSRRL